MLVILFVATDAGVGGLPILDRLRVAALAGG